MTIPEGYKQVTTGYVKLGDLIWVQKEKKFVELDENLLNDLRFLDATAVEELIRVARKEA